VRPGEDVREAAAREVREETGLEPRALRLRAVIHEVGLLGRSYLLFAFVAEADEGRAERVPRESREGELAWFEIAEIPWHEVVPDLRELLPRLLEPGEPVFGTQRFDGADGSLELRLS
jgi:ADP-ribose pyrophosphatase YjhB (NUDIX family)